MIKTAATAVLVCLLLLFAQEAQANECLMIKDDDLRLNCYDQKAKAESAAAREPPAFAGESAATIEPERPMHCLQIAGNEERLACYRKQLAPEGSRCSRMRDLDVMLHCFDVASGRAHADDRFVLLPKPSQGRIMLKSDAKPITIMGEIDAKPAEISVARRDGDHFVDAKAALVWQRSVSQAWSWFGGGAWTRTDKASGRKDVRRAETGLQWTRQNDAVRDGWWHVLTGSISYENDIAGDAEATGLGLVWEFGSHAWMGEKWTFAPALGLRTERGEKSGDDYDFSTVYAVGAGSWKPSDRFELFVTGGYLDDFGTSSGLEERDGDFGSLGLKYFLYDKAGQPALRPEIRLVRYFGVNPLDPDAPVNETRLTLGVLFDSLQTGR